MFDVGPNSSTFQVRPRPSLRGHRITVVFENGRITVALRRTTTPPARRRPRTTSRRPSSCPTTPSRLVSDFSFPESQVSSEILTFRLEFSMRTKESCCFRSRRAASCKHSCSTIGQFSIPSLESSFPSIFVEGKVVDSKRLRTSSQTSTFEHHRVVGVVSFVVGYGSCGFECLRIFRVSS